MALSKQQIEDKEKFKDSLCMWERDILDLAHQFKGWYDIALSLGFTEKKIDTKWMFPDAGRLVKVMSMDEYRKLNHYPTEEMARRNPPWEPPFR